MPNKKRDNAPAYSSPVPVIQYVTAQDIMTCVGIGRTKAYEIIKRLNAELESEGYLTFPGKVPERKFRERLYLPESIRTATNPKGGGTKRSK